MRQVSGDCLLLDYEEVHTVDGRPELLHGQLVRSHSPRHVGIGYTQVHLVVVGAYLMARNAILAEGG